MLDSEKLKDITKNLTTLVAEGQANALKALGNLPEGETKQKLKGLLDMSAKGKVDFRDAQRELEKIIENAY